MHMADALISPAVGGIMMVASVGAITYSVKKIHFDLDEKKIPVMGVMGAFVFAAQMINFAIPATGSSGHIGGGILLAALLGGPAAFLVMTAVLTIQALFFADGGLLALGCNIFNIGVIPCLLAYPLIYRPITKKGVKPKTISIASILAVVVGLQLGAFGVVTETVLSGRIQLPFATFLLFMQPIHLAIGLAEGVITAAVLCFIYNISPELLVGKPENGRESNINSQHPLRRKKRAIVIMIAATVITGGIISGFASAFPDGLEWAVLKVTGGELENPDQKVYEKAEAMQGKTALMPDYALKDSEAAGERSQSALAGITGSVIVLLVAGGAGLLIKVCKRKKMCQS